MEHTERVVIGERVCNSNDHPEIVFGWLFTVQRVTTCPSLRLSLHATAPNLHQSCTATLFLRCQKHEWTVCRDTGPACKMRRRANAPLQQCFHQNVQLGTHNSVDVVPGYSYSTTRNLNRKQSIEHFVASNAINLNDHSRYAGMRRTCVSYYF